jgi:hypothetical protein
MSFDIVIPLGPNERKNIYRQIEYTKKNVIGYRNIYIVTNNFDNIKIDGCQIIDENIFPFKMNDIASYFAQYNGKNNRNGWYLQQLIKLYTGFVIEDILDTYLVIDADVFFLKPIEFYKESKFIFTTGNEEHKPYFTHMSKLHSSFQKVIEPSGISHHMLFNRNYLKEIFDMVENIHNKHFWKAFIECVEEHKNHSIYSTESGASEYEIYFNYMVKNHRDKIEIRQLNWCNKNMSYDLSNENSMDYISLCSWMNY